MKMLSIIDVAKRLGLSRGRVHQLCMQDVVPFQRLCEIFPASKSRQIMIDEADLAKLRRRNTRNGPIPGRKRNKEAAT